MPLVIEELCRFLAFILTFFSGKKESYDVKNWSKSMCRHQVDFVKLQFLVNQFQNGSF